jgi:MarR family transcriptional regulator for hemolysin
VRATRSQWVAILRLARTPGLTQKELADLLEVEPITVARLIDRMVAAGLIERRADETDRRVWRLHLRPEARDMVARVRAQRNALADEALKGIDAATLAALHAGLAQMKHNLAHSPRLHAMAMNFNHNQADDLRESA